MLEEKDQIEEIPQENTPNLEEVTQEEVTEEVTASKEANDSKEEEAEEEAIIVSAHDDFDWTIGRRDTLTYSQKEIDDYII